MGKGNFAKNTYKIKVNPNTGSNKFRLKQIDYTNIPHYSRVISYRYSKPAITYKINKSQKEIILSAETLYELYNYKGTLITKGNGDKVSYSGLEHGIYYFNFDNKRERIKLK